MLIVEVASPLCMWLTSEMAYIAATQGFGEWMAEQAAYHAEAPHGIPTCLVCEDMGRLQIEDGELICCCALWRNPVTGRMLPPVDDWGENEYGNA